MEIPIEKLVEQVNTIETYVDVPLPQEVIREVVEDVYEEKVYSVVKTVYKPKFIPKYVDRYVDKFVDVKIEVPKLVFREVIQEEFTDKPFESTTIVQRLDIKGQNIPREMNTKIIREVLSENQKRTFNESSRVLAKALEENVNSKAQLDSLNEIHRIFSDTASQKTTEQLLNQLRNQAASMESSLKTKTEEVQRLRDQLGQEKQIEQVITYDEETIPQLREQIQNIKEHNEYLRSIVRQGGFKDETFEVGTELVHHNTIREAPVTSRIQAALPYSANACSYNTGSYSSRSSRSNSPAPRYTQPITTSAYPTSYPKVVRQSSPAPQRVTVGNVIPTAQAYRPAQQFYQDNSRSSSAYSSGPSRSYSSRSVSPSPIKVSQGQPRVSNIGTGYKNNYQREIDSVVNKYQRPAGPTPVQPINNDSYRRMANDFMDSGRSPLNSIEGGKQWSNASTSYPNTLNNTGRLIGDYSMVNQALGK